MNNNRNQLLFGFFLILGLHSLAVEMGIPVQLRLKSPAAGYPNQTGVAIRLQVLSPTSCILREELFSSQSIVDGVVSLTLGSGTRGANDPNIALNLVYNNSQPKTGLTCVDAAGSIVGTGTTYAPAANDARTLRFQATVAGDALLADFPMRSTSWAIQAENAEQAIQFTGSLAGDVSGTQASTSVDKIKGVAVSSLAPTLNQYLKYNGTAWEASSSTLSIADIPNLDWSKITTGKPTTLAGYGITDAGSITLPPSQITQGGAASGQVLKWNGSAWVASPDLNSGGTVTNVSSANSYLSVATGTTTPALTLNVGTGTGTVAAGNDSRIVGALPATAFNTYVASANCTMLETMYWNSVSSTFSCQAIGTVPNATTAVNFSGALVGDVNGTQGVTSVDKIKGIPVSTTAPVTGQVLVYNGTQWVPTKGLPSFAKSTVDQTFSTTALANATGLSFGVTAGTLYKYRFNILYTSAATTTGLRIGLTYPAVTTTSAIANIPGNTVDGTAFTYSGLISTSGDSVVSASSPAVSPVVMMANIEGVILPSANGVIQLQAASEIGGSNIVIKANSFVEVTQVP